MNSNIDIGDEVKIIDWGGLYSSYVTMSKKMGLKNWKNGYRYYENVYINGTIISIEQHPNDKSLICGIRLSNNIEIIINQDSLELIKKKFSLPDELFVI